MCFGRIRVELQRALAGGVSLRNCFISSALILRAENGTIGETGIRKRIMRIERDRATIHVLRRIESLAAALMKELATAEIVLVCADALCRNLLDRCFFVRSQNELQRVDDVRRYLILDLE